MKYGFPTTFIIILISLCGSELLAQQLAAGNSGVPFRGQLLTEAPAHSMGNQFKSGSGVAELSDTTRRNTIKVDLTSYWLYRNALVFSYERVMKPYQTFAITGGIQEFPNLDGIDSIDVTKNTGARGYKFGAEYRFYLKKENKHAAPRGVFIGPYFTLHHYKNTRDITVDNDGVQEFANLVTRLDIINIGVQLGYQFVFNDRWTVDLVLIGPSMSNYRASFDLEGNYTFDADDVKNDVAKAMLEKFPGIKDLLEEGEVDRDGKLNTWGYGYRYQVQIGYRFGKKK